jgi:hypothetical protein
LRHEWSDDNQRLIVRDRSQTILPFLKERLSFTHVAREEKPIPCLLNRWGADYRRLGVRARCLKLNADKGKRRTFLTIQQLLGRLAMLNLDQAIPTVTEVDCESRVVGVA